MSFIDLRSDTVTKPTYAMRQAMVQAEVGDDVYGEDPTVNQLEAKAADLLGKEAGLFVPTGVMANQLAIRLHTRPGDEVIVDASAHIIRYEGGSASSLSGVQLSCLPGDRGRLSAEAVLSSIRPQDLHNPPTTLVCLEQTHNAGGGSVYPFETIQRIVDVARTHHLKLHLDGARLFNAVAKTGISAMEYARPFDTVSFCLSKGLGAPIGSMLVADRPLIHRLRRLRKLFGGGMRQVGILAAAGIYALDHHIARLSEDHANATHLATLLGKLSSVDINVKEVETNILLFHLPDFPKTTDQILTDCREKGVLFNAVGDRAFRLVTHLDISPQDIERAGKIFSSVFGT